MAAEDDLLARVVHDDSVVTNAHVGTQNIARGRGGLLTIAVPLGIC